ncbi:MAG: M4 family metallopeptidase [Bacteroidales bacterium]|jgi:hypothetical protein|nr:M4 family metallopeptidase [Bacteroidales bacterium]
MIKTFSFSESLDIFLSTSKKELTGIGKDKATKITYRSLTNGYLTANSQYIDAAISSVRAAMELYGDCSYEALQTYQAWQAVGVTFSLTSLPRYDISTDCSSLYGGFSTVNTVTITAVHDISSDCDISAIQKPVHFYAGNEITLKPGFVSNEDFHANIVPCLPTGAFNVSYKSLNENNIYVDDNENIVNENEPTNEKNKIILYPNPNSGSFTIGTNNVHEIEQIQVINLLGQIVYKVQNPDNTTVNLPVGTKGAFFVKIITQTETVVKRIIVE